MSNALWDQDLTYVLCLIGGSACAFAILGFVPSTEGAEPPEEEDVSELSLLESEPSESASAESDLDDVLLSDVSDSELDVGSDLGRGGRVTRFLCVLVALRWRTLTTGAVLARFARVGAT